MTLDFIFRPLDWTYTPSPVIVSPSTLVSDWFSSPDVTIISKIPRNTNAEKCLDGQDDSARTSKRFLAQLRLY
jgi:hypothetical protein